MGLQVPSARGRRCFTLALAIAATVQDAKAITAAFVAVLPLCGLTIADPSSDTCSLNLAHQASCLSTPWQVSVHHQAAGLDPYLSPRGPKVWPIKAEPLWIWKVAPHAAL